MKVTNHGMKDRKLHQEGCPQKEVAEQPGYVEASAHVRIAEHNDIIASLPADSLLKQILSRDNLNGAYKKVMSWIRSWNGADINLSAMQMTA